MTTIRIQRKPVTLEAIQWTGGNWDSVRRFAGDKVHRMSASKLTISAYGDPASPVRLHDWIIKEKGGYLVRAQHELTRDFQMVD